MPDTSASTLTLKASDIGGRYHVLVSGTPKLPTEKLADMQYAQGLMTPDPVTGKPIASGEFIREHIISDIEHPDVEEERLDRAWVETRSERIGEIKMLAAEESWIKANPDLVKLAEKARNPEGLPNLTPDQMEQFMSIIQQAPGGGPPAAQQAGVEADDSGSSVIQETQGAQPSPSVLPPQLLMAPGDVIPDRAQLQQSQQRRAFTPPRP